MTVTVERRHNPAKKSKGDRPNKTVRYIIRGTADEDTAEAHLSASAPDSVGTGYDKLERTDVSVDPRKVNTDISADECVWDGIVKYERKREDPDTNSVEYTFSTSGETEHINQSLKTVGVYGADGYDIPDTKNGIGVTKDSVEGTDVVVPTFEWQETHYRPAEYMSWSYLFDVHRLTGTVNQNEIYSFRPGEVLFLGIDSQARGLEDDRVTYKFAARPNKTNLKIGDITGIDKKGWEYLWVRYEKNEQGTVLMQEPKAVFIEQVYEYESWKDLEM